MIQHSWSESAKWTVWSHQVFTPLAKVPATPPLQPQIEAIGVAQVSAPIDAPEAPTVDASAEAAQAGETTIDEVARLKKELAFWQGEVALKNKQIDLLTKRALYAEAGMRRETAKHAQDQQEKTAMVARIG